MVYCTVNRYIGISCNLYFDKKFSFVFLEKNIEHLKKVKSAKSEAEIQAILSHHLFVLLAPSAEYLIDGHHSWPADLKKCPACHEDLNLGNTSIGKIFVEMIHVSFAIPCLFS